MPKVYCLTPQQLRAERANPSGAIDEKNRIIIIIII